MSGSQNVLISPQQGSRIYNHAAPRQRNVFLVRFLLGASALRNSGLDSKSMQNLSFVVKHTDRPKVTMKTEELNQYNKKRQIYTGFKHESLRMTFYDDAQGRAQNLWDVYSQYYFGDFVSGSDTSQGYDITAPEFMVGNGFGLTENYAGSTSVDSQWFFDRIQIFHFYISNSSQLYDKYELIHPRITNYEPDEFDYETSAVSSINMTLAYENLQYTRAQAATLAEFEEFAQAGGFFTPQVVTTSVTPTTSLDSAESELRSPVQPNLPGLLNLAPSSAAFAAPYRNVTAGVTTSGPLALFGSLSFGTPGFQVSIPFAAPAATVATASPLLAVAYGGSGVALQSAMLQSGQSQSGFLSPAAYATYNANQIGTAQIGFNANNLARSPTTVGPILTFGG